MMGIRMNKMLYKSKLLIIIYLTVTVFLLLSLNIFQKARNDSYKEATYLSNDCVKLMNYQKGVVEKFKENVLKFEKENIFLLKLANGIEAVGYSNSELFQVKLKFGRKFSMEDFHNKTDTVIVSETLYENCTMIDGVYKYLYENIYYEVIGVLDENSYDYINSGIKLYINGFSDSINRRTSYIIWDSGKDSVTDINQIIEENQTEILKYNTKEYRDSTYILQTKYQVIIIFFIMSIVIFINVVEATKIWFDGRKKEYTIRMLLGESKKRARRWVEKIYLAEVFFAMLLGIIATKIFLLVFTTYNIYGSAMRLFSPQLNISNILIIGTLMLLIGYLTCLCILWKQLKKGVINIIK